MKVLTKHVAKHVAKGVHPGPSTSKHVGVHLGVLVLNIFGSLVNAGLACFACFDNLFCLLSMVRLLGLHGLACSPSHIT